MEDIRIELEGIEVMYLMTEQEKYIMRTQLQAVIDEWCRKKSLAWMKTIISKLTEMGSNYPLETI